MHSSILIHLKYMYGGVVMILEFLSFNISIFDTMFHWHCILDLC